MAAFATAQDLVDRWKGLSDAEYAKAGTLLEDASVWLRVWFPAAESMVATKPTVGKVLTMLAVGMVKRAMLNGENDGQASSAETIGPFAFQTSYKNPEGNLYLTKAEVSLMESALESVSARGAVSMQSPMR